MSHDFRDRSGGHQSNMLEGADIVGWTQQYRKFAKKLTRREMRREQAKVTQQAVLEYECDLAQDYLDQAGWELDMDQYHDSYFGWNDLNDWAEEDMSDYDGYDDYDPYYDDPYYHDFEHDVMPSSMDHCPYCGRVL